VLRRRGVGAEPRAIIKVYFFDSPASMSIHEEATVASRDVQQAGHVRRRGPIRFYALRLHQAGFMESGLQ
jgi:hypothetical protein